MTEGLPAVAGARSAPQDVYAWLAGEAQERSDLFGWVEVSGLGETSDDESVLDWLKQAGSGLLSVVTSPGFLSTVGGAVQGLLRPQPAPTPAPAAAPAPPTLVQPAPAPAALRRPAVPPQAQPPPSSPDTAQLLQQLAQLLVPLVVQAMSQQRPAEAATDDEAVDVEAAVDDEAVDDEAVDDKATDDEVAAGEAAESSDGEEALEQSPGVDDEAVEDEAVDEAVPARPAGAWSAPVEVVRDWADESDTWAAGDPAGQAVTEVPS